MKKVASFCMLSLVSMLIIASQNDRRKSQQKTETPSELTRSQEIPIPTKRIDSEKTAKQHDKIEVFSPNTYLNNTFLSGFGSDPSPTAISYR